MKLKRIEAVRFGRLVDCALGDLGDGLTVVLGPNEAGKSTFTHLVRYVLYGFPTRNSKQQPPFLSPAGEREGRLVFAENGSEWVMTRSHGVNGGPLSVRAMAGEERPALADEITRGVTGPEYGVVFGFGLDELAEIERDRGSENDIVSRLYAAGAGVTTSPQDVRTELEKRASELFAPRASKPAINSVLSQIKQVRAVIRELEDAADGFAEATDRMSELTSSVQAALIERDEAAAHFKTIELELERIGTLTQESDELGKASAEVKAELAAAQRERDVHVLRPEVLGMASTLDPLLAEISAARERRERMSRCEAEIASLKGEVSSTLDRIGMTETEALAADLGPETVTGVETWRGRLTRLSADEARAAQDAGRSGDAAAHANAAATQGAPSERDGTARAWPTVAAILFALLGVAAVLASVVYTQPLGVAAGIILLVAAGVLLIALRSARVDGAADEDADTRAEQASESSQIARIELERVSAELAAALSEWSAWATERGLGRAASDPAAASLLVGELSGVRSTQARIADRRREIESDAEAQSRLASQLWDASSTFMDDGEPPSAESLVEFASRLAERLESARETAGRRAEAETHLGAVQQRLDGLTEQIERARAEIAAILERQGLESVGALSAAASVAGEAADARAEEYARLSDQRTELAAVLGGEERERAMIENRQQEAGLRQRLDTLSSEYVVLALALRLLDETRLRYERERQPEVIRIAQEVFGGITGGRYERLAVPLGDGAMTVFDASSEAKETAELSRGTAEQLYLSLRIALIRQMGEVGCALPIIMDDIFVNFDEERRRGAVEAVADLARSRQVVVFTCHEDTAELLAQVAPGLTRLSLDRC